jgi:hypothetical protein
MGSWGRHGSTARRGALVVLTAMIVGVAGPASAVDGAGPATTTTTAKKPAADIVPAPTTTAAPAPTTTLPTSTTTLPGASIIFRSDPTTTTEPPKTTILSIGSPTTSTTTTTTTRPPTTTAGAGPLSGAPAPLVRATGTGSFSRILRLLEAAAAGPGPFDAALADAERAQERLRSELDGAVTQLAAAETAVQAAGADVAAAEGALLRATEASTTSSPTTSTATTSTTVVARAQDARAAGPPTLTTISRSAPVTTRPPATVLPPVDPAPARRQALAVQLDARQRNLAQAQTHAEEARQAHLAAAGAADAAGQTVVALRDQLWSRLNDPTFRTAARVLVAGATASAGPTAAQVEPSTLAVSDVPAPMLALYRQHAATCPGLSWTVLAAIGSVESNHGRTTLPGVRSGANFAGAMGPMQFLAGTWAIYGADGDGDGDRDVYDPADAVRGSAAYLCASGAGRLSGLADALWAYNHAGWYVDEVLALALRYGSDGLSAEKASAPEAAGVTTLVALPNIELTPQARADMLAGKVDPRVMRSLAAAAASGHKLAVSVIESGHSKFVSGTTRVSNHYYGRAVDIYSIDGVPVSATNDAALEVALAVLTTAPELRPDELGSPWPELSPFPGAFSDADHVDHLHLGWSTN